MARIEKSDSWFDCRLLAVMRRAILSRVARFNMGWGFALAKTQIKLQLTRLSAMLFVFSPSLLAGNTIPDTASNTSISLDTTNIGFHDDTLLIVVALFLTVLLAVMGYGKWIKTYLSFQSNRKQSFIDSLLNNTKEGVWIANKDRDIEQINNAFTEILGLDSQDVVGKCFKVMKQDGRNYEVENVIWQEVIESGFWHGEIWTTNAEGDKVSVDMSVTRITTESKFTQQLDVKYIGMMFDVTARKQNEQAMHQLATRDQLTDLPNRTLFVEYIKHSICTTQAGNPHFAIAFIDLDNFKKVNASIGLLQGDKLIQEVSKRLQENLDSCLTFARLGGDEFAVLVPSHLCGNSPVFYIKRLVADIQHTFESVFVVDDVEVNMTTSIGVAIFPNHGTKADQLMRCADTALNRVKISGRNDALVFDHAMDDISSEQLNIESELVAALSNRELVVFYQPVYHSQHHSIAGFEALVRWQSPARGLVPPDQFVPIAEQNGLIRQLDFFVLEQAFAKVDLWQVEGVLKGRIAVNISSVNFQQADFVAQVEELVARVNGDCHFIELELTETAMMKNADLVAKNINKLKLMGFTIALDDFGTGYSSLGHLRQFNIDKVKIDRSFINEIEFSVQDRNITSVMIQMANALSIQVVAEGVENEKQAYMLHVMGCFLMQGYLISRPLPEPQLMTFMSGETQYLKNIVDKVKITNDDG